MKKKNNTTLKLMFLAMVFCLVGSVFPVRLEKPKQNIRFNEKAEIVEFDNQRAPEGLEKGQARKVDLNDSKEAERGLVRVHPTEEKKKFYQSTFFKALLGGALGLAASVVFCKFFSKLFPIKGPDKDKNRLLQDFVQIL